MNRCNWEVIEGFSSPSEYERFCIWLNEQIDAGVVKEVAVDKNHPGIAFLDERWFVCYGSSEAWKLLAPEVPFRGYWGPV